MSNSTYIKLRPGVNEAFACVDPILPETTEGCVYLYIAEGVESDQSSVLQMMNPAEARKLALALLNTCEAVEAHAAAV